MEWSSLKGRGPRWFTVRKTDLLYKDITFWLSLSFFFFCCCFLFCFFNWGNLFRSSSTQFLLVLLFWAVPGNVFCSNYFFLGLLLRSLSTQLFVLVALLCLVLSMTAFCYEHFLYGLCWSLLPPGSLSLESLFFVCLLFFNHFALECYFCSLFFSVPFFFFFLHSILVQCCLFCFRCCKAYFSLLLATVWRSVPRLSSTKFFSF